MGNIYSHKKNTNPNSAEVLQNITKLFPSNSTVLKSNINKQSSTSIVDVSTIAQNISGGSGNMSRISIVPRRRRYIQTETLNTLTGGNDNTLNTEDIDYIKNMIYNNDSSFYDDTEPDQTGGNVITDFISNIFSSNKQDNKNVNNFSPTTSMNFTETSVPNFSATSPMNFTENTIGGFSATSPMNHTEPTVPNFSATSPMNFTENTIGGFSATSPMNHTEDVVNNFSSTSPMNHTEDVVNNFSSMNPTDKPADVFSTPSSITTDIDANTDLTIEHEINAIKNILQSDVKQSGGNDNPDISNSTSQNPVALSAIMGGGNKTPLDTNSNTGDDNDSDNKSDTDDDSDTDTDTDSTSDVKSNDNKEQSDSMVSRGGDSDILKILSASTTASSSSTTTTTSSSSTDNYSSPIDPRTHAINSRRNNMSKYMNDYVITSNSDTNYKVQTRPFYSSQSSDFLSSHGSEYLNNLRYRDRSQ